jgi:7-cyano-7-deazaguanine synthase
MTLVLLSGGQDSTTVLAMRLATKRPREPVHALTIDYGQRHRIELDAARRIAKHFEVPHEVVEVRFPAPSALTGDGDVGATRPDGLPATFVPGRNLHFLMVAAAHAHARGLRDVVIGASHIDYSGYPDCRPVFTRHAQSAIQSALDAPTLTVEAPLVYSSKADTVRKMHALGAHAWAGLALSWTCYDPQPKWRTFTHVEGEPELRPCGRCPACVLRAKGFAEADLDDPALSAGAQARARAKRSKL